MQSSITQKTWRRSTQHTIEYNGVRVLQRTFTQQIDFFVPFEELPNTRFTLTVYHKFLLALTLVIGVVACFVAFTFLNPEIGPENFSFFLTLLGIGSISALLAWLTRKQFVGFSGSGQHFVLRANKPSRAAVDTFLEQLLETKTTYLRDMYLTLASDGSPAEQLRKLLWLKEHGAITQQELEERKRTLLPEPAQVHRLGFAMK